MTTVLIDLDSSVWHPGSEWVDALTHVAARFARVRALDVQPLLAASVDDACRALDDWAADDIDWRRELARWCDEHLPRRLRTNAASSRLIRAMAADGTHVIVVSALPDAAAASVGRNLGLSRGVEAVRGDVNTTTARASVAADSSADIIVTADVTRWPDASICVRDLAAVATGTPTT